MKGYTLLPSEDYETLYNHSALQLNKNGPNLSKYKSIFKYSFNSVQGTSLQQNHNRKPDKVWAIFCHNLIVLCSYVFLIVTAPCTAWFCIKKLLQHERVIIFRLGRQLPIEGPGMICVFPWIDNWTKVDLRMRAFIIPPQHILLADGSIVELSAEIRFRVCDVVKSITCIQNLDQSVRTLGRTLLINTVQQKTLSNLTNEKEIISKGMQVELNASTAPWGLEISHVELSIPKIFQEGTGQPSAINSLLSSLQLLFNPQSTEFINVKNKPSQVNDFDQENFIFKLMKDKVFPLLTGDALDPNGGVFKLEITGKFGGTFWMNTKTGQTAVGVPPSDWSKPDIEVTLPVESFIEIINGSLSPLQGYISGNVNIVGNTSLLYGLQNVIKKVKGVNFPLKAPRNDIQIV